MSWRFLTTRRAVAWSWAASGISRFGASEQFGQHVVAVAGSEAVEAALAGAAVFDQARLLELREVGGDGALAHDQDFLQLGDGELFGLEQQQDAEPVGVGYDAEDFHN